MPQAQTQTLQNSDSKSPLAGLSNSMATSFQSTLSRRLAQAMLKHQSMQSKWLKQIEELNKQRDNADMNSSYHKRKLEKSLRNISLGSLIERQSTFKYDEYGSKKPGNFWQHKSPRRDEMNPADLQNRVNSFY